MPNTPEQDPIEAYLDEVCSAMKVTKSYGDLASRLQKDYGIEVTEADVETNLRILQPALEQKQIEVRDARTELETHLLAIVNELITIGFPRDEAIVQAIGRFGDAKILGRRLGKALSRDYGKVLAESLGSESVESTGMDKFRTVVASLTGLTVGASFWVEEIHKTNTAELIYLNLVLIVGLINGCTAAINTTANISPNYSHAMRYVNGMKTVLSGRRTPNERWSQWLHRELSLMFYRSIEPKSARDPKCIRSLLIGFAITMGLWFLSKTHPYALTWFTLSFLFLTQNIGGIIGELVRKQRAKAS